MASNVQFFAWAAPAMGYEVLPDHTWVTTYDSTKVKYANIQAVVAAERDFWYCWGNFRTAGGTRDNPSGALGQQLGNLMEAHCLVQPNVPSRLAKPARGTIFNYGHNGVCHQLANQVLQATGSDGSAPLTVERARGYYWSVFRFGTYGIPESDWIARRDACKARGLGTSKSVRGKKMASAPDEFETRARDVLKDQKPEVLKELLALRHQMQKDSLSTWSKSKAPTAEELNTENQKVLDRISHLLGPTNFERIFDFLPNQRVELFNPALMQAQQKALDRERLQTTAVRQRKVASPTTVTLKHLAAALAEEHELSKKSAEMILGDLVSKITKHLKKGERIRIVGLGVLQVRKRAARMGRNPSTREEIKIKAGKKVAFSPAKELKDAI